jgi:hypothetical protein
VSVSEQIPMPPPRRDEADDDAGIGTAPLPDAAPFEDAGPFQDAAVEASPTGGDAG